LEEFDDPQAVRNRFALLRDGSANHGGFNGLLGLGLEKTSSETGKWVRATLQVPQTAAFFSDHFPRRAVFPGSLLMHTNLHLAAALAEQLPAPNKRAWTAQSVLDVKLRTFIPPGTTLELEARVDEFSDTSAVLALESRAGKRIVGTARVVLSAEDLL
jgi:3-hydroxymyristoyl/3-hydroxydecanoyl-(acyl carrier protein) dehydratase